MAHLGRPGLSGPQKMDVWQQWKIGHSLSDIGRTLGKHAGLIHRVVSSNGGIVPGPRRRSRLALTLTEREEISRGLAGKLSMRQMAVQIGRPASTGSREIARHGGRSRYRATVADGEAWEQVCRPKSCRLALHPILRRAVTQKLSLDWSPEQISGWLRRTFPDDERMRVSHETIYRSLFIQARGVLKKELTRHLRSKQMMRRSKRANAEGQPRGRIIDGGSIRERPADVWQQWKIGHSLSDIGHTLGKHAGSIHRVVSSNGGIVPGPRRRSRLALTLTEREEISRGLAGKLSMRQMAVQIGRPASTGSREIARHGGRSRYRATVADGEAWEQVCRPKSCRLALHPILRRAVTQKLSLDWSPEQISGWLRRTFPDDERMRVSHETIYRSLFIQARGVLKKELTRHLRSKQMMRRSKRANAEGQPRGRIIDGGSIRERPADVNDRAIPGHWEGDLITGSKNTHMATLVERQSRFTMLVQIPGKDTTSVVAALIRQVRKLPAVLRRSLTWDRGMEMAQHKRFTVATNVKVYFCDPHSPWQRGTNENTNRLLRQYFPKGTELSGYSQADLDKVALRLNTRPRKTLAFQTPADTLQASVATTG